VTTACRIREEYLVQTARGGDQVQSLRGSAAQVADGLEAAEEDAEVRNCPIEELNVAGTLAVEDEEKVVYASPSRTRQYLYTIQDHKSGQNQVQRSRVWH
jgi:hypothetical protein